MSERRVLVIGSQCEALSRLGKPRDFAQTSDSAADNTSRALLRTHLSGHLSQLSFASIARLLLYGAFGNVL